MPKNTRIILPSISRESAHRIAKAASLSFEYEIYDAEYNFLLLSGFILYFVVAFIIYHIDQNIH